MLNEREVKLVKIRMVILDMTQSDLAKFVGLNSKQQVNYCLKRVRDTAHIEEKLRDFIKPISNVDIFGL